MKKLSAFFLLGLPITLLAQGNFTPLPDPVFGQDQAIRDNDSGLVWLNLQNTTAYAYNWISNTPSFSGYRYATADEVRGLFAHEGLYDNHTPLGGVSDSPEIQRFIGLFGATGGVDRPDMLGLVSEVIQNVRGCYVFGLSAVTANGKPVYNVNLYETWAVNPDIHYGGLGNWLVQVPEPNVMGLGLLGLAVFVVLKTIRNTRIVPPC